MNAIDLPAPPPFPPGVAVPMRWDWGTQTGEQQERLHRLAVLHDLCPECTDPLDEVTREQWLCELAQPQPVADLSILPPNSWLTPEGEHASFVHGTFRLDEPPVFESWAETTFTVVGDAFAHIATVDGEPWTRALFWLEGNRRLRLETASLPRYFHLESVFEHLWPPVFRCSRIAGPLDDRMDKPYRNHHPCPPAEASVFTRLRRADEAGHPPR